MLVFDCVMYTVYYNATMIRVHGTSKNSLTPVADALFCCCCVLAVLVCRRADLSIAQYVGRGTDMYYVLCMRRNKTMPMPMRNAYRWHTICILYMYKHIESEPHIVYTIFVVLYSRQTIFGVIYEAKPFRTLGMFCRTNFWRKKKNANTHRALSIKIILLNEKCFTVARKPFRHIRYLERCAHCMVHWISSTECSLQFFICNLWV